MVTEMETQGRLKRVRLDGAKNNKQLMEENIEELGSAEQRDKTVQTKVPFFIYICRKHVFRVVLRGESWFVAFFPVF